MKRTIWTTLLALLLAAALPCAALAAPGDANLARSEEMRDNYQDNIMGGCAFDGALCLYGNNHFFLYRPGDEGLTAVEYQPPEVAEGEYRDMNCAFTDGESLYMLSSVMRSAQDEYGLDRAELYPVEVDEQSVHFGEPTAVDVGQLTVNYGGDGDYMAQIEDACFAGGKLMLLVYDSSGQQRIYAMDVASGQGSFVEGPETVVGMAPYADGQLLVEGFDYDAHTCEFSLYDPQSERMTAAAAPVELEDGDYSGFTGLAYSQESGRLFYMSGGYVMAVEDFDFANARPVAELSTLYGDRRGGVLLPGDLYVSISYESVAVRATDPEALPETQLVVKNPGYSDATMDTYYSFGSSHPDVAVVLDQDYEDPSALIEKMMNRDDTADIYILSTSSAAFDALYNRGYMVELDSEAIASAVEKMYPPIREALERDGAVVAVPASLYGWTVGLDYEGFEKIGIPREDVPDSWKALLELLPRLPDMLPEDGSVSIFSEYESQESVRSQLFGAILDNWHTQANANGRELRYDDPALAELLGMALDLDLGALGLPEGDDEGSYSYAVASYGGDNRHYNLVQFSTGFTIGNFYTEADPAPLKVLPDEEAYLPLSMNVAFVNPFSKHVELARAFLEEFLENLDEATVYNLSDERNEPVRDPQMLQYIEETQENIENMKAKLETAEAVDKPALEEQIREMEAGLESMERNSWKIPERDIQWYRAHADRLTVERYNFLDGADEDGELSDMAAQLMEGKVPLADFLKEVDRKVRMRMMEGN